MTLRKKLTSLALAGVMAFGIVGSVGTSASSETDYKYNVETSVNNLNTAVNLSVPLYYQSGETWSSKRCGGSSSNPTIAQAGCAITSVAMVQNYYKSKYNNTAHNPGEVNDTLGSSAYPMSWTSAATTYGLTVSNSITSYNNNVASQASAMSAITSNIRSSKPVIIGLAKKTNSSDTHFVVGKGVAPQNAYVYINDPAGNTGNTVLQSYTSNYYIYRVVVYS